MKQVLEAAKDVQNFLEAKDWNFCFIGGIALQRWAIPRNTNDADITLLTGIGPEEDVIRTLLEKFESRIENNPMDFFLPRRIVLVKVGNVGVDISLGALEFEEHAVERATYHDFVPNISLKTCTAEDLIVFKAFADRLKDWADIESIISVQSRLDWPYIIEQLSPLVEIKHEPEILDKLAVMRKGLT